MKTMNVASASAIETDQLSGKAEVIEWALRGVDRQKVKLAAARAGFFSGTEGSHFGCAIMKRFFFDLVGDIRAHDFLGRECSSKKEAKKHASFVAHRIGTERPSFAKPGNFIAVRDERGAKIFAAPITSVRHV